MSQIVPCNSRNTPIGAVSLWRACIVRPDGSRRWLGLKNERDAKMPACTAADIRNKVITQLKVAGEPFKDVYVYPRDINDLNDPKVMQNSVIPSAIHMSRPRRKRKVGRSDIPQIKL